MPTREHVAGCAWCQQELARYTAVDEALRRGYGAAAHENILPFPFDLDGDEDVAEDYAFTLEDTLEETMAEGHDPRDSAAVYHRTLVPLGREETRARSTRDGHRGIAAALILAVIATAVYTQFAARRTTSSPAATKTSSAFTKVALPNAKSRFITQLTTAPDGSFWYADSFIAHTEDRPCHARREPSATSRTYRRRREQLSTSMVWLLGRTAISGLADKTLMVRCFRISSGA